MIHRLLSTATLMGALALSGCTGTVANLSGAASGSTVLKGANAAVGGVNYTATGANQHEEWDRHVTACHYGTDTRFVFSGDGADLLSYAPQAPEPRVVLHGPNGAVSYSSSACRVVKLTLTREPVNGSGADGKLAMVCDDDGHELNASIRFERCGA